MELTAMQRRTVGALLGDGSGAEFDPELPGRLRAYLLAGVAGVVPRGRIRLSKERLNDLDRCPGSFQAAIAGERPAFEPTARSAVGNLLHRALELDAATAVEAPPDDLVRRGCAELAEDVRYGPFWAGLDQAARDTVAADARAGVELFRASFPPLGPARRLLAPVAECWVSQSLCGGLVTVSGRIDLIVGRFDHHRSTRVLVDLKTGGAWPAHAEDMRLYALLFTLRFGAPPLRVATFFLRSGESQPEDVSESMLMHSADRIIRAMRAASRLGGDPPAEAPDLRPGTWCRWCPRGRTCPASAARDVSAIPAPGDGAGRRRAGTEVAGA
jgi:RecB family exonuclease